MVSLKDVASACNVSVATVSKALNDHHDIGEATKERVRLVARQMGYFPNSAAKALKTNRTNNIGVLFAEKAMSGLTHDYFSHVLDSFKRTAEERGYDITFININKTGTKNMTYLEHARYRGFDGVIIACTDFADPEVAELIESNIPVVTIDYVFNNCMAVVSDNVKGMRDLLSYIIGKGHRNLVYIHGENSTVTQQRLSTFYHVADEFGLHIPEENELEAPYRNVNACFELTKKLLSRENRPTCILYPDDYACLGGINAIREMGLEIGKDISVAGYDGLRFGRYLQPQLTTIRQDTESIGREAAKGLVDMIEKPKSTVIRQISIKGSLVEGKTVGEIPTK